MKKTSLLLSLLLAGCISGPPKATSIEDYCDHVASSAERYKKLLDADMGVDGLKFQIRWEYGRVFHKREVDKMLDTVDMVVAGKTPDEINRTCVTQRTNGTWFKEAV